MQRISRRLDRNYGPAFPAWKMCVTNLVFDSVSLAFYSIFPPSTLPVTYDWATGPRMGMPSAIESFDVTDFSLSITEIEGSNWDQPTDIRSVSNELTLFVCENNTDTKTFPDCVYKTCDTAIFLTYKKLMQACRYQSHYKPFWECCRPYHWKKTFLWSIDQGLP